MRKQLKVMLFASLLVIVFSGTAFTTPSQPITGIVVDARGLALDRAMSPNIIDAHGIVLNSIIPNSAEWVASNGSVEYYDSNELNEVMVGKSRAGKNFLFVKAVGVKHFNNDVVISEDDSNKIMSAFGIQDVFKQGNIVFIQ